MGASRHQPHPVGRPAASPDCVAKGSDCRPTPRQGTACRQASLARPKRARVDALLLTTTGRRSGRERTVVLQFFPDGNAIMLAAANDGGQAAPAWYLNLKANPSAHVEVRGRKIAVLAEELAADEAARTRHPGGEGGLPGLADRSGAARAADARLVRRDGAVLDDRGGGQPSPPDHRPGGRRGVGGGACVPDARPAPTPRPVRGPGPHCQRSRSACP